jgi:dynein heavy chain, axonemal
LDNIVNLVRGDLSPLNRLTLEALIVITVHTRDISAELLKNSLADINSFLWISQLRYYWEECTTSK